MAWEVGVSALLAVVGAVLSFRAMRRASRRARRMKGRPLITADDVELGASAGSWPMRTERWPTAGSLDSVELVWAYANAARRRSRVWELAGDVGVLFGSAWLGIQLVTAWPAITEYFQLSSRTFSDADPFAIWPGLFKLMVALTSAFVLAAALALKGIARDYQDIADSYENVGSRRSSGEH